MSRFLLALAVVSVHPACGISQYRHDPILLYVDYTELQPLAPGQVSPFGFTAEEMAEQAATRVTGEATSYDQTPGFPVDLVYTFAEPTEVAVVSYDDGTLLDGVPDDGTEYLKARVRYRVAGHVGDHEVLGEGVVTMWARELGFENAITFWIEEEVMEAESVRQEGIKQAGLATDAVIIRLADTTEGLDGLGLRQGGHLAGAPGLGGGGFPLGGGGGVGAVAARVGAAGICRAVGVSCRQTRGPVVSSVRG